MSKMRMSQVVREMVELDIADKVRRKGDRKDYIQVENDYYQTFISLFTSNWQREVRKSRAFGQRFIKDIHQTEVSKSSQQEKEELDQEMEEWQNYYEWIDRVVEFFESEDIFIYILKKDGEIIYYIYQIEIIKISKQEKEELAQEIEEWQNYYEWIDRVVEFFESEDIFKYVPKKEGENINGK